MHPVICILTEEKNRLERVKNYYRSKKLCQDKDNYKLLKIKKDLEFISRVLNYTESIEKDYI